MPLSKEKRIQALKNKLLKEKDGHFILVGGFTKTTEKATFKHVDCGYIWDTTPITLFHSKDRIYGGCPKCQYDKKRIGKKEFVRRLQEHTHGEYVLSGEPLYKGTNYVAGFIHKKCGTHFTMTAQSIFVNNISCPKCFRKSPSSNLIGRKEFEKRLFDKYKGEYILAPNSNYTKLLDKVEFIHTTCGTHWITRASHILYDSGCPKCNQSKGENLINSILEQQSIEFKRQLSFENCVNKKELPFDFGIMYNNKCIGLIEYDGIQHFKEFKHFGGTKKFKQRVHNDHIKNKFCSDSNLPLLRLKYTLSQSSIEKQVIRFINCIESKAENSSPKRRAKI